MSGSQAQVLQQLVAQFNASHHDYQVRAIYKGTYEETLISTVSAFRAGHPPHVVQVSEIGTATMLYPKGVIVPIHQLLPDDKRLQDIIPAVHDYYADERGRLLALPFNVSVPLLYINSNALARVGAQQLPHTWPEVVDLAKRFRRGGFHCGFTSAWLSWIHLENFSSWHNQPFASGNNGFTRRAVKLVYATPLLYQHLFALQNWQRLGLFRYGGRDSNASTLFINGDCPMLLESSGSLHSLSGTRGFAVKAVALPFWPGKNVPQNTLIGGAAWWVLQRHSQKEYAAIRSWLSYLLQPDVQALWARKTGYLPVSNNAYRINLAGHYYRLHPGAFAAWQSLTAKPATPYSRGIRLGNYVLLRNINNQMFEAIFSGQATVRDALARALEQGNLVLKRFALTVDESS